jgi:hypothetical protein
MERDEPGQPFESDALNRLRHDNPFGVPEGYFDGLPAMLAQRLAQLSAARVVPISRFRARAYAAAACAAVAVLLAGVYFSVRAPRAHPVAMISYEDISQTPFFYDLDERLLVDELARRTAQAAEAPSDAAIEEYLIENATDISVYYIENQ